jgi:hypothetical protein
MSDPATFTGGRGRGHFFAFLGVKQPMSGGQTRAALLSFVKEVSNLSHHLINCDLF